MTLFKRSYWLWILWVVIAAVSFFIFRANPSDEFAQRASIMTFSAALGFAVLYTLRRLELRRIPVQRIFEAGLVGGIENPHYGLTVLAIAIFFAGAFMGISSLMLAGL